MTNINWKSLLVINPKGLIYQTFDNIVIILSLASSMIYAYYAAYRRDVEGNREEDDDHHMPESMLQVFR